jgi:hypothetical protein
MRPTFSTLAAGLAMATALAFVPSAPALADGGKLQMFGLTADQQLIRFREDRARTNKVLGPITNLSNDSVLVGIDFRPANGFLYALGNQGGIYTIDTDTAEATFRVQTTVNGQPVVLSGTSFGVDFNPTVDRLRVVGDDGQNLRINVDNGVATVDGGLNFPGVPPAPNTPALGITGVGYTNNDADANTGTTLFDIDSSLDQIEIQLPPNAGALTLTGKLGVAANPDLGFDIWSDIDDGTTTAVRAFATITTDITRLYEVNVLTGKARDRGRFRTGQQVIGLAITLD